MNWKNKIDISDVFSKYKEGEIEDITEVAKGLIKELRAIKEHVNKQIEKLFIEVSIEGLKIVNDEESFYEILEQLYDWGDRGKRLWIQTIPR